MTFRRNTLIIVLDRLNINLLRYMPSSVNYRLNKTSAAASGGMEIVMFPNRIKILRKAKRLSQKRFAEDFAVDQTAVSNWEQGKNNIDVTIADKIADSFGVPVEFVYGKPYRITRDRSLWKRDEIDDYENAVSEEERVFLEFKYGRGVFEGSGTTLLSNTPCEEDIKLALFGGDDTVTDEMWEEVKSFVEFVKQKRGK